MSPPGTATCTWRSATPLDVYDTDLSGLIANDQVPDWTQVTGLTFAGEQDYAVTWQEDSGLSYSEDDVYFTQQDGESLPLDTSLVEGYLRTLQSLGADRLCDLQRHRRGAGRLRPG